MADALTWRTPVRVQSSGAPISWHAPLFFMGSCFTEHLGNWLTSLHFQTMVNPSGILYNPESIARTLARIAENRPYTREELFLHDGLWCSPDHHGSFSHPDAEQCIARINRTQQQARTVLQKASHLFLTLGSAVVYRMKDGRAAANCHKLPQRLFTVEMLTPDEAAAQLRQAAAAAESVNPDIRTVFTVSPIRHYKDDLHRNTLSKSVLHLAVETLCRQKDCMYFPAFEIMQDDLRDYRFYATDLLHPGPLALEYLRRQFAETFMDNATRQTAARLEQLQHALQHRPLHPGTAAGRQFAAATLERLEAFQAAHPEIDLGEEISALSKNKY